MAQIVNKVDLIIVVSKIDENCCKQTLASLPFFGGIQVVSVYSYNEPPTEYCICMWSMVVNTSSLPVYKKYI